MSVPRRQQKLVISRGTSSSTARSRYGWRALGAWAALQERVRRAASDHARWLRVGRALQSDTDCKRLALAAHHIQPGQSFRVVDAFGRTTGQRLTAIDHHRDPGAGFCALEAHARDGLAFYLEGNTRVRICNMQTEDMHSRFSRMLKAAHRSAA